MRRSVLVACLAALVLGGLFPRADRLGQRSFSHDEVLHVLAAKGLAATGAPLLPSGEPYRRALPVTRAVAFAFEHLGESEAAARVPSVVAGVLAIPAVFLLGRVLFGPTAGLVAAALLAFSPDAVAMSRFVRMYAWAQLLVVLAAAATARGLLAGRPSARLPWLAIGVGLTLLTARLHAEAYLLLAPLGLYLGIAAAWLAATGGRRAVRGAPEARELAAGALAAALVFLVAPDRVLATLESGLTRLPWFPAEAWDPKFYHLYLAGTYDYLWFLA
ncbi:MAG TPA: glycosyltransferase family 39 protein, partial [Thermodesulfobacteriota bacterium]